jgi:hypothetical protein
VKLIQFPDVDVGDIARGLRRMADDIEKGEYGDAFNLAWVMDCGEGHIEVGLLGRSPEPGAAAHLLFGVGMSKLSQI